MVAVFNSLFHKNVTQQLDVLLHSGALCFLSGEIRVTISHFF